MCVCVRVCVCVSMCICMCVYMYTYEISVLHCYIPHRSMDGRKCEQTNITPSLEDGFYTHFWLKPRIGYS